MTPILQRFGETYRRALLAMLVVLIANVGVFLLVAEPARLRAAALRVELEKAAKDLGEARLGFGQALLERRLLTDADARIDALNRDTFATSRERYSVVDSKMKELAARFRLEPHAFGFSYEPMPRERLEKLTVSFNLKGSYDRLRQFVTAIEQASNADGEDLFFAIERIGLADASESGAELNLTLGVSTYFHKPELEQAEKPAQARAVR